MESTTNWLSNLKIRFGYGVTGSTAGIDPYSSAASLDATAVNMIIRVNSFSQCQCITGVTIIKHI